VAPAAARRGIGRQLMGTVRDALPDRALWLSVWALNHRALAFYEAQQGRRLGETWFELEGQQHPNWIYAWPARQPSDGA
jgi:ribosomal protein S18 acetylase RimI-like enzyme